jgi:hypothetical protein
MNNDKSVLLLKAYWKTIMDHESLPEAVNFLLLSGYLPVDLSLELVQLQLDT